MDESAYFSWSVVAAGVTALATVGLAVAAVIAGRVAYRHLNVVLEQMQATAAQLQLATDVARHQRSAITHEAVQRFLKIFNEQHRVLVSCASQIARERYGGKSPTGEDVYTPQEMMSTEEVVCNHVSPKALRAMDTTLNELEQIAVGSELGVYNDLIIYHVMHNVVEYISELSAPFAQLHRQGKVPGYGMAPEAYVAIEQLCVRLEKIQQDHRYVVPEQTQAWRGYE